MSALQGGHASANRAKGKNVSLPFSSPTTSTSRPEAPGVQTRKWKWRTSGPSKTSSACRRVRAAGEPDARPSAAARDEERLAAANEVLVAVDVTGDHRDRLLRRGEGRHERPPHVELVARDRAVRVRRMVDEDDHPFHGVFRVGPRELGFQPAGLLAPCRVTESALVRVEEDETKGPVRFDIPTAHRETRKACHRVPPARSSGAPSTRGSRGSAGSAPPRRGAAPSARRTRSQSRRDDPWKTRSPSPTTKSGARAAISATSRRRSSGFDSRQNSARDVRWRSPTTAKRPDRTSITAEPAMALQEAPGRPSRSRRRRARRARAGGPRRSPSRPRPMPRAPRRRARTTRPVSRRKSPQVRRPAPIATCTNPCFRAPLTTPGSSKSPVTRTASGAGFALRLGDESRHDLALRVPGSGT